MTGNDRGGAGQERKWAREYSFSKTQFYVIFQSRWMKIKGAVNHRHNHSDNK